MSGHVTINQFLVGCGNVAVGIIGVASICAIFFGIVGAVLVSLIPGLTVAGVGFLSAVSCSGLAALLEIETHLRK